MIEFGEIVHYRYDASRQETRAREVFDKGRRALSIRQPYAEQIMRGFKKVEYRGVSTNIRGRSTFMLPIPWQTWMLLYA